MMRRTVLRRYRFLLALLAASCFLAVPVAADAGPTIARPSTYHYRTTLQLALGPLKLSGVAEGDFDFGRRAFHVVSTIGTIGSASTTRSEQILVDGVLYSYDEKQQRWEYTVPSAQEIETLFARVLAVPVHPTATFAPSGSGDIGGMRINDWHASNNYNELAPLISPRLFSATLLEEVLTIDLSIGAVDNYLYRGVAQEQGTVTSLGDPVPRSLPVSSKSEFMYSNFNQAVTIVAPPNAQPASGTTSISGVEAEDMASKLAQVLISNGPGDHVLPRLAELVEP